MTKSSVILPLLYVKEYLVIYFENQRILEYQNVLFVYPSGKAVELWFMTSMFTSLKTPDILHAYLSGHWHVTTSLHCI